MTFMKGITGTIIVIVPAGGSIAFHGGLVGKPKKTGQTPE
jgi:hypothetical protein